MNIINIKEINSIDKMLFKINDADKLTILSNGNVGIGTTSPSYKLDVNDTVRLENAVIGDIGHGATYCGFIHSSISGANKYALLQNDEGETYLNCATGKNLNFRIENSTKMQLNSNGNIGIGTTSPGSKLDVNGDIKTNSGFQVGNSTRLYKDYLDFNYNGAFHNWGSVRWGCGNFQSGSYGRLYLAVIPYGTSLPYASGPMMRFDCHEYLYVNKTIYASGFTSTSDLRMKKNINNINSDESLNKILQLSPISYDFIDETKGTQLYGFVAQDVINIVPEAVTTRSGYLPTIMKSFNYELNKIFIDDQEILNKIDVNKYYAIGKSQLDSFTPYKILEKDLNSITIENLENNSFGEDIYIYGECSNDINSINHNHVTILNTASIQELNKKIVSLEDKIESQEILINNLINRIEQLESIN